VKGTGGQNRKEERINITMATQAWYDIFYQSQLHNIISHQSNHYPILLNLRKEQRRSGK
jgi:hypothetical protein